MTETTDRPLVTFALFAYNQEQYIREAVEGAFAQTYEPLEIILSDDCSTDRTFEIMQEMAAAYEGPHRVRAVQTEYNLGVTPHVLLRGKQAAGEIVVLAAGDDISRENRCERHVACYSDKSIMAVTTGYDIIDEHGGFISQHDAQPIIGNAYSRQRKLFDSLQHAYVVIQGSTSSYRREVFDCSLPSWPLLFSEDNLFNFLIYCHGYRVAPLNESLVQYRQHDNALSNISTRTTSFRDREIRSYDAARKEVNKMKTFSWIAANSANPTIVNTKEIEERREMAELIAAWPVTSAPNRLASVISSAPSGKIRMLKWKAARIIGSFPDYQPAKWIRER